MAESDSFKVIQALRDGADYFWNSISSLETAIVNVLCTTNDANKDSASNAQQTPKTKISNLENSICNFIEQIFPINPKVEGDADIIAQWKRNNLERDFSEKNEDEIEVLVEKTRQNAINLYREISGGSETQKEIKLITLLHANRLKLINEVLSNDSKSEEVKLEEIKDIIENKGNFNPNFNLMDNIYFLTEVNFQPGDDLEWRSLLPEAPRPAKATSNSSSIYPPQRRDPSQDRIILDKETKEQLLFRLIDFKYSCLGVLESGADNKVNKIRALETLCQKELTTDYAKEYSATKKNIQSKIEKGARFVEEELGRIKFEANILANQAKETPDIRQKTISSLLDDQIETIQNKVAEKIKEDKFIEPENEDRLALKEESQKQIEVVKQYAENIAKSGIYEEEAKMLNKLTDFQISKDVVGAIRTAMYNEAFIQISFAKGRELVEKVRKMTGDDVTPPPSPRNSRSHAPSPSLLEGSTPPPDYDNYIDELLEKNSTPDEISEEIEYHKIAQQLIEPPIPAPRRPQKSKEIEPPITAPRR